MKLEVFPIKTRNGKLPENISPVEHEAKDAWALRRLHGAGLAYRHLPGTAINAVAFFVRGTAASASALDSLSLPGIYVMKAPDSILEVPGAENDRAIFMDLAGECSVKWRIKACLFAFAWLVRITGCTSLSYLGSPEIFPGKPFPSLPGESSKASMPWAGKRPPKAAMPPLGVIVDNTEARKRAKHLASSNTASRAYRRIGRIINPRKIGKERLHPDASLEELKALADAGEVSPDLYYSRRREMGIHGREPAYQAETPEDMAKLRAEGKISSGAYYKARKRLMAMGYDIPAWGRGKHDREGRDNKG